MIDEEWRDVVGYEGGYEVSNMGRVRSLDRFCNGAKPRVCNGKLLRPRTTKLGYHQASLWKDTKVKYVLVHRLVAMAFIANQDCLPMVNHIDGNKGNNVVPNLEWVSDRTNKQHAIDIGRITRFKKLLTSDEVSEIRLLGGTMTQANIAKRFGCTQTNVSLILRGRTH